MKYKVPSLPALCAVSEPSVPARTVKRRADNGAALSESSFTVILLEQKISAPQIVVSRLCRLAAARSARPDGVTRGDQANRDFLGKLKPSFWKYFHLLVATQSLLCRVTGVLTEGCRPCRSSSNCQPLSAPFTRQLQTRNLVPWGTSMAATVCHAGVCVPEAAEEKDSFCDRLAGALVEPQKQEQVGSMQVLGAAVASAAMKMQQELDSSKAGSKRRSLQDQTNTINFSPAPAPMYNVTVPVVGIPSAVAVTRLLLPSAYMLLPLHLSPRWE